MIFFKLTFIITAWNKIQEEGTVLVEIFIGAEVGKKTINSLLLAILLHTCCLVICKQPSIRLLATNTNQMSSRPMKLEALKIEKIYKESCKNCQ